MKIPCPICGYYLPPITQKIKTDSKDSISSYLDILSPKIAIKKIWPKRNNYTWMIGFFKNKDFFQNRRLSP
jgi:tetrahydromethanopterin S-methyltransferase subunit B